MSKATKGKTVEQIYQKKTQHEHILARPDTYIGTINAVTEDMWVYDTESAMMTLRRLTWIPGLYKLFDEILVNAADNKVRDPTQSRIEVVVNKDEGCISVYNDGDGIPVEKHKEHGIWVPELIFGHLLTSSNYDDDEAKVTGGRNGYGAKLTNVFSKKFQLETVHRGKRFKMKWTKNMLHKNEPEIDRVEKNDFTKITFYPEFERFGLTGFEDDIIALIKRRVYDIAGCTDKSLKCKLNGERLHIDSFGDYVALYPTLGEDYKKNTHMRVNDRWEVCVRLSNIGFQQVSFVNSIATTRGGTHVKMILDQILDKVTAAVAKKHKNVDVKPFMIKPHIWLFVNCLIENPAFDSQTKETLNTPKSKFGSTCVLPDQMIDAILKSGIVERAVETANNKLTKELSAKVKAADRGRITGIPKLEDANDAGGKNSIDCTLILTEGDSAKALAVSGLAVVGRDKFGVFPLRGKPLNVREAGKLKIKNCEEIQAIIKIMGLKVDTHYTDATKLRYGRIMIMADQDHDGSHIKGLLINFIHVFWPSLLAVPGFITQFITPIVKALPANKRSGLATHPFFSIPDFLDWKKNQTAAELRKYTFKYYKGLGTSTAAEGREYFSAIAKHKIEFAKHHDTPGDDDKAIEMAFAKDKVADRKEWINNYSAATHEGIDFKKKRQTYKEFVDKELILFSVADCERSIPNAIDGLKPGQRKILFACFKRNLTRSIKVAQLAGYVSEHAAYHHGEASLNSTIVGLAQDYVGSNNVPLLVPDGQFGTRHAGGKDHASARYIFTCLNPIARLLYPKSDDYLLEYKDDDGFPVEPHYYVPVIPMVLVNGTAGIGTGFATSIPNYSPFDVIDNVRRLIDGQDLVSMVPWYYGYAGDVAKKSDSELDRGRFASKGKYRIAAGVITITELPIEVWTNNYKKYLEDLVEKELLLQFREYHTDITVDFDVVPHPTVLAKWIEHDCILDKLNLTGHVHATNIHAFDRNEKLHRFGDPEAVIKEFFIVRQQFYGKRKDHLVGELRSLVSKLENMQRFVTEVVNGTLVVARKKKADLLRELRTRNYAAFPPQSKKKQSAGAIAEGGGKGGGKGGGGGAGGGGGGADASDDDEDEDADLLGRVSFGHRAAAALRAAGGGGAPATTTGNAPLDIIAQRQAEDLENSARDYDYLLGLKLWSLTQEMVASLVERTRTAQEELRILMAKSPTDLWREDLKELEEGLNSYFGARRADALETLKKKKAKSAINLAKMRIPTLSDAVTRQLDEKPKVPLAKKGRRAAAPGAAGADDDDVALLLDGGEDGAATTEGKRPRAKRAPRAKKDPSEKKEHKKKAAAAKPKRKKRRSEESEDDEADEDLDFDDSSSDDDDDDDDDDSDSDDSSSGGDDDTDDSDADVPQSRRARRTEANASGSVPRAKRAAPKRSAAAKKTEVHVDSDEETFATKMARAAKATMSSSGSGSKPAPKPRAKKAGAAGAAASAPVDVDDFDIMDFGLDKLTSQTETARRSYADDDEELLLLGSQTPDARRSTSDFSVSTDLKPAKTTRAKPKAAAKAATAKPKAKPKAKKKKKKDSDDDDDFLVDSSSEDDDDDSDDSDDSDFDDDSSDEDFDDDSGSDY